MKIKKFIAPSMPTALSQIKKEFGEDAIILQSKKIEDKNHPEWKNAVEVTAAIEKLADQPGKASAFSSTLQKSSNKKMGKTSIHSAQLNSMQKEIEFIGNQMEVLINHIKYENLPHIPKTLQQRVKTLITNGVNPSIANSMIEEILLQLKGEELLQSEIIDEKLILKIKSYLSVSGPIKFNRNCPTIVPLIGPTGAGKTITAAKLAAQYKYTNGKKVALLSADSYRIAAMEQLKNFAEIAKINFFPIYQNEEALGVINKLNDHDLIIIDTAGINPKDMKKMVSLKELLRVCKSDEIHLVLSLTTRCNDLKMNIRSFNIFPITGIIYTKLDETSSFGDLLNISNEFDKPCSFLATGQEIPEDLVIADRREMALMILRGKYGIL